MIQRGEREDPDGLPAMMQRASDDVGGDPKSSVDDVFQQELDDGNFALHTATVP